MSKSRFEKNKSDIQKLGGGAATPHRKKRRRTSIGKMALVMTVLAVAAVGTVLSLTVFFKIKTIDVYGESRYSSKQIIDAGNIQLESNLIRLDKEMVANRIETKHPYIEKVDVKKVLPTTVELHVTKARVAGYCETKDGYSIVSTNGKVLEISKKKPQKGAVINGIDVEDVTVAGRISDDNLALSNIKEIFGGLGEGVSSNITELSVSDNLNLSFVYRDRVTVRLGSSKEISKKLKFVLEILNNPEEIAEDDIGTIYASNPKRISFLRQGSYSELQAQIEKDRLEAEKNESEQNESEQSSSNQTQSTESSDHNIQTSSQN